MSLAVWPLFLCLCGISVGYGAGGAPTTQRGGRAVAGNDASGQTGDAPKSAAKVGRKRKPVALPANIYANCDNVFSMYLNGREVLSGDSEAVEVAESVYLRAGDRLLVKVGDTGGSKGFACVIQFPGQRKFIRSNTMKWSSFTPKDDTRWSDPNGVADIKKATLADNQAWKLNITTRCGLECEAIWGSTNPAYLLLEVTDEVAEGY